MSQVLEAVSAALNQMQDRHTQKTFAEQKSVKNLKVEGGCVFVDLQVGYPIKTLGDAISQDVKNALLAVAGVTQVELNLTQKIVPHVTQGTLKPLENIKNIIAVASGKGGVGKSTTAVNLALALHKEGANVGILDADIYGPSLPHMLGLVGKTPEAIDKERMKPLRAHGLQAMSIGFLIDVDTAMVWRGPMVTQALTQLISQTQWENLDYLIVDMPPGTGDTQLTLAQKVPVTGAVIVTTPQDIALIDAKKGLKMFEKVGIPILGLIENMSLHICSACGHEEAIFGQDGGQKMSAEYGVEFLGALPLTRSIRELADTGCPTVIGNPDSREAAIYQEIARRIAIKIAVRTADTRHKFPSIVVQNT